MDEIKNRFLSDRVMTATPAQRVVMLYDRLALDLARARGAQAPERPGAHLGHAAQIVAELYGSLDQSAGGPAANLAGLYQYLLQTLMTAQITDDLSAIETADSIVSGLRAAWTKVADGSAQTEAERPLVGTSWTA